MHRLNNLDRTTGLEGGGEGREVWDWVEEIRRGEKEYFVRALLHKRRMNAWKKEGLRCASLPFFPYKRSGT